MKTALIAALLIISSAAGAQRFSIGARTGIGLWAGGASNGLLARSKPDWKNEVFGRYAVGRHFAFEIGAAAERGIKEGYDNNYIDTLRTTTILSHYWKHAFYGLNLRAQYQLLKTRSNHIHNYIGVVFAPTLEKASETIFEYQTATKNNVTTVDNYQNEGLQGGIEDMLQYRCNRHAAFHLLIGYRGTWSDKVGYRGESLSAQFGAAYTF